MKLTFVAQSNSSMHHYEGVGLTLCLKHQSPERPISRQISRLVYPKIRRRRVITNAVTFAFVGRKMFWKIFRWGGDVACRASAPSAAVSPAATSTCRNESRLTSNRDAINSSLLSKHRIMTRAELAQRTEPSHSRRRHCLAYPVIRVRVDRCARPCRSWASAHRGKRGQLTPWENG